MSLKSVKPPGASGGLYKLLSWMSPSFPVGAYTYSHGLEFAAEQDLVRDAQSLFLWVSGVLAHGAGRTDADLLREAHAAALADDQTHLTRTVELGDAYAPTQELGLESKAQGAAFLKAVNDAWPAGRVAAFIADLEAWGRAPAYPVAVGVCAAVHGIAVGETLEAYLHAFAANLVSAAVRYVPLGQTDGQVCLARLQPNVAAAAGASLERCLDDFGAAAPMVDWASMNHETQYTRLFRS